MRKIILASASNRRSEILSSCGIKHEVRPSKVEEIFEHIGGIKKIVELNAVMKSDEVAKDLSDSLVIGADTLVMHANKIIGKPVDENEAMGILLSFSGEEIDVYTGSSVIDTVTGKRSSRVDVSKVFVGSLEKERAEKYFKFLGPYDKAGGFSIEGVGSMIFDKIEGSYFNILGLSMIAIEELFEDVGLDVLDFISTNENSL